MGAAKGGIKEGSFRIQQEMELAVPVDRAWAALVDVGGWWCHHFAKVGPKLVLEPRLGGRFYEAWGEGEGALWGTVIFIRRPEVLRLSGPLGMNTAVNSVYEFGLEPAGDGTLLTLSHQAIGFIDSGWKKEHKKGWAELWKHLKVFAETGERFRA